MRVVRVLSALVALALLGVVQLLGAPADAGGAGAVSPACRTSHARVCVQIVRQNHREYMVGKVTPVKGPVVISRATTCNRSTGACNFAKYASVPVQRRGYFSGRVTIPKTGQLYWQARVGPHKSLIWVTCKTTTSSCSSSS